MDPPHPATRNLSPAATGDAAHAPQDGIRVARESDDYEIAMPALAIFVDNIRHLEQMQNKRRFENTEKYAPTEVRARRGLPKWETFG